MGTHPIFESDFDCLTDMSDYEGLSRVVIVKKKKNDPLGFKLKYDTERKGNCISFVTEGQAAANAGLQVGDRLLMVKKTNVESMSHDDVVSVIKKLAKKDSIQFGVVSGEADPVNPARDREAIESGEQIFNISRIKGSYGFSLSTGNNDNGTYKPTLKDIKSGGAAEKAGMKDQMTLIAMNGRQCEEMDHKAVVREVKSGGKNVIIRCRTAEKVEEAKVEASAPAVEKVEEAQVEEAAAPVAAAAVATI